MIALETFETWKARTEQEIEEKILGNDKIRRKLIANSNATEHAPKQPASLAECAICLRAKRLTKHHLTPREIQHRVATQRGQVMICRCCHDGVHFEFTNEQLHYTPWEDVARRVRIRLAVG